jgi:hypothetical protein
MAVDATSSFYSATGPTPSQGVELEAVVADIQASATAAADAAEAAAKAAASATSSALAATASANAAVDQINTAASTAVANLNASTNSVVEASTAAAVSAAQAAVGPQIATALTFSAGTGATARPVLDRVRDLGASLLDYVPAPADLSAYDVALAINAAFAAGIRRVYVPARSTAYVIKTPATVPLRCALIGDGARVTLFNASADFKLLGVSNDPKGVFVLAAGEPAGTIQGIGVQFQQPGTATTRAELTKYCPAIYAVGATRCRIADIYISGAWDGVDLSGNAGGFFLSQVECGAANRGLYVEGSYDFPHIDHYHFWVFGFTAANLQAAFADSAPVAAYIGRADGINISDLSIYRGRLVLGNPSADATPGEAPRQLSNISLDGDGARITILGGSNNLTGHYSTKTNPTQASVEVSGGITTITPTILRSAESVPFFAVSAGRLQVIGGQVWQNTASGRVALVTGGRAEFIGLNITRNSGTGAVPSFEQSGAGVMVVDNCSWLEPSGGSTKGYPAVVYGADVAGNRCSGNTFNGYSYSVPADAKLGSYGPNKGAAFSWSPAIGFAGGNGTFAPVYSTRSGRYWFEADRMCFEGRIVFTVAAYSGHSGGLQITGLPFTTLPAFASAVAVMASGFTIPAGDVALQANLKAGGIQMRRIRAAAASPLEASDVNVPSGSTVYDLCFSGSVLHG